MDHQSAITKDKGYAWFAAFGMCVANLFGLGIASYGNLSVLVYVWIEEMEITAQQAGLVSSLVSVMIFLPGPLYSVAIHAVGCWKTQIAAAVFLLAGYIMMAYSYHLWYIVIGYSLLTGFGSAIAQVAAVVALEDYFHVHKDKVWTLMVAAYSAGLIAGPPLLEFLIQNIGYKLAVLTEGGAIASLNLMAGFIFGGNRLCLCRETARHQPANEKFSDDDQSVEQDPPNNNNNEIFSIDKQLTVPYEKTESAEDHRHSMSFRRRLLKSLHLQKTILKSPRLIVLLCYHIFISSGEITYLTYVIELAVSSGLGSPSQAAFGPMINGISSVLTSVAIAILANYNKNPLILSIVFTLIFAISVLALPFSTYLSVYCILNFLFGVGEAGYISCIMFNISYLFGNNDVAVHRLAYVFVATGLGFLLGPLVVGYAIQVHGSTKIAFYIGGSTSFFSALFLIGLFVHDYLKIRRTVPNPTEMQKSISTINASTMAPDRQLP